jgi:formiminoglutamase
MHSDMTSLKIYTQSDVFAFINKRKGEKKFGEKVTFITDTQNLDQELIDSNSKYVLFGIIESIGVKANKGHQGTETAWSSVLKSLLNTQNSPLNKGKNVLLLGCLEFPEKMAQSKKLNTDNSSDLQQLYTMVSEIDEEVTNLIFKIVSAGKIPIVIGGGHNNAYGNIKGSSLALNKPLNVINFDAHTDFRSLEGRHSGNGFSYAKIEGFLSNYFIFGLHENYLQQPVFEQLNSNASLAFNSYESIEVRKELSFKKALKQAEKHSAKSHFGLELDCDAIININSSAQTPSGFSVIQTRQFITHFSKLKNLSYFHICEASSSKKTEKQVGKLLSYFILDFINANHNL